MANAIANLVSQNANDARQVVITIAVTYIGDDVAMDGGLNDVIATTITIPGTLSQFPAVAMAAIASAVQSNAVAHGFTVLTGHTLVLISGNLQ